MTEGKNGSRFITEAANRLKDDSPSSTSVYNSSCHYSTTRTILSTFVLYRHVCVCVRACLFVSAVLLDDVRSFVRSADYLYATAAGGREVILLFF